MCVCVCVCVCVCACVIILKRAYTKRTKVTRSKYNHTWLCFSSLKLPTLPPLLRHIATVVAQRTSNKYPEGGEGREGRGGHSDGPSSTDNRGHVHCVSFATRQSRIQTKGKHRYKVLANLPKQFQGVYMHKKGTQDDGYYTSSKHASTHDAGGGGGR